MCSEPTASERASGRTSAEVRGHPLGQALPGLLAGLLFGVGLVVSGMSDPAKVIDFLDVMGAWDPSLAFVLAGATGTAFAGFRLVRRRERPLVHAAFELPTRRDVDAPLVVGATLFGVGWGVGGFCPGPAWTALPLLAPGTLVFVPAMVFGLWTGGRGRTSGLPRNRRAGSRCAVHGRGGEPTCLLIRIIALIPSWN